MFSHPYDPQSVIEVREHERQWIMRWIHEANNRVWRAKGHIEEGDKGEPDQEAGVVNGASTTAGLAGQGAAGSTGRAADGVGGGTEGAAGIEVGAQADVSRMARVAGRAAGKMRGVGTGSQW